VQGRGHQSKPWVSDAAFQECEQAIVFSSVDIIILRDDRFLLGKRRNEPGEGTWALPGGIVRRGETREEAVIRIAKFETGLDLRITKFLGSYDHLWPTRQYVSNCYLAKPIGRSSDIPSFNEEFSLIRFFKSIPSGVHRNYTVMLEAAGWTS